MRLGCIDIGSNTTRLLVADCAGGRVVPVVQERVFTHIAMGRRADGTIDPAKIDEVARVVGDQLGRARGLGAGRIRAVATAAIRLAGNSGDLAAAVDDWCGLRVDVLSGEEEARLAFIGAVSALETPPAGELGVVDVGGGSCELAVGNAPDQVHWSASLPLGSAELTRQYLHHDPPAEAELSAARARVAEALAGVEVPKPRFAMAVGGSAASLYTLTGPLLGPAAFGSALEKLAGQAAGDAAHRFGLEPQRVRLLPAGLLILDAAARRFGMPLLVGGGGLREGVVLELARMA